MTCSKTEVDLPGDEATTTFNNNHGIPTTSVDVFNFRDDLVFRTFTIHYNGHDSTSLILGRITRVWVNVTWTTNIDEKGLPEKCNGRETNNRVSLYVRDEHFTNDRVMARS